MKLLQQLILSVCKAAGADNQIITGLPGFFAPGQVLRPLRGPAPGLPSCVPWFHVVAVGSAENMLDVGEI